MELLTLVNPGGGTTVNVAPPDRELLKRALNAYLQQVIVDWLAEKAGRTNVELAQLTGLTDAQIITIKKHGRGVGDETTRQFAHLLGISRDELEARALAAYREQPPPAETRVEYIERYANRTKALEMMGDDIRPETKRRVLSWAFNSEVDLPVSMWLDRIRVEDAGVRWEEEHPRLAEEHRATKRTAAAAKTAADRAAYAARTKELREKTGQKAGEDLPPPPPKATKRTR